jgi:hypothetical protein
MSRHLNQLYYYPDACVYSTVMFCIERKLVPDRWLQRYWTVSRFLGLVVSVTGFYAIIPIQSGGNRLTATSIFASLILTFALIVVYQGLGRIQQGQLKEMKSQRGLQEDVVDIQEQQAEIMEQQEEWMEAGYRPHVTIERWEARDNEMPFYLRNVGNGPATNLVARIVMYANWPPEEPIIEGSVRLSPENPNNGAIKTGVLQSGGEPRPFTGELQFHGQIKSNNILSSDFPSIAAKMVESDFKTIAYRVFFEYQMINGEHVRNKLWEAESELSEGMTLEALIDESFKKKMDFDYILPYNLDPED